MSKLWATFVSTFFNNGLSWGVTIGMAVFFGFGAFWLQTKFELWNTQRQLVNQCEVLLESAEADNARLLKLERTKNEVLQTIDDDDDLSTWADAFNRMLENADQRINDN